MTRSLALLGFSLTALLAAPLARAEASATPLPPPVATATDMAADMAADTPAADTVQVPELKQSVRKGESILPDNIMMVAVPRAQVFASTITSADELAGQQAVRPLDAGEPVNRLHVRVAPLVARNQIVTMVYSRGGVELSGSAQALQDGQKGDSVRILNPATRTTLTGTVQADGTVKVE